MRTERTGHQSSKAHLRPTRSVVTGMAISLLCGCTMVGPNFERPSAPAVNRYTSGSTPRSTVKSPGHGGAAQQFTPGAEVPPEWWQLFRSKKLDAIAREALAGNQNLKEVQARLREAEANLAAEQGTLYPQLDANAGLKREQITGAAFGGSRAFRLNLITATADVSFNPDVFGGERRAIESQQAAMEFQHRELQATYLTLLGNVANAVIQEASTRAQIQATNEIIASDSRELGIIETQYHVGTVSYSDVLNARSRLAATRATLPVLEQQLAQTRHLLATLVGKTPAQWRPPEVRFSELTLPRELPVSVPSRLVRQRPDILASESQLHQASAQVGVATANLYPSFTINASYGTEATTFSNLFTPGAIIWNLGASVLAPLFHGGTLRARRRAAVAAYEAALATYRQTVLSAFQQVADVLRALEHDAQALRAREQSLQSAHEGRSVVEAQFEAGRSSYLDVLTAQSQYQQARVTYLQARAQRYRDTVALFTALGGGWWNAPKGEQTPTPTTAAAPAQ